MTNPTFPDIFTDAQWCYRIGLPYKTSYSQEYIAMVKALVYWRTNLTPTGRRIWWDTVEAREKKYAKNGELLINYDWKALKQKKQGIFGYGYSDTLSPIQGYRHPWTLTQNEFKIVYEEFKLHMTPNGVVPDNRFRIPSLLTQVSTIITASNIAGDLTRQAIGITRMFPIVKLFTTSVTLVGWGQSILDAIEKQKFSEELKSLSSSYEKERIFRDGGY